MTMLAVQNWEDLLQTDLMEKLHGDTRTLACALTLSQLLPRSSSYWRYL
jgi:carbonic anhydrase